MAVRPTCSTTRRRPPRPAWDACPAGCGGHLFWFAERSDASPELLCSECVTFAIARDYTLDPAADVSDLPAVLRLGKPNDQRVYRIVRDLGRCRPADVLEEYARRGDPFVGRTTVCHALARLRDAGLLSHTPAGWSLCSPRGRKGGA